MAALTGSAGIGALAPSWQPPRLQSTVRRATGDLSGSSYDSACLETTLGVADLLDAQGSADARAKLANGLSTAGDALDVIGGLLDNVQTVLSAAPGSDDLPLEQSRIDSAVTTIDAIAGSTRFGGKPLLDGTFAADSPAGTLTIPSFLSTDSPGTPNAGSTATLSTLTTGGANDLSSGNLDTAGSIVSSALGRIAATQSRIATHCNALSSAPAPESVGDALDLSAGELLSSPLAVYATANTRPATALSLLAPR